jgi:hypothetical protein
MSYEEKGTWVYLVVSLGVYIAYVIYVLGQGVPLTESNWVWPIVISIGVAIVAAIILRIAVEIVTPSDSYRSDVRDKSISRQGDAAGNALIIAGALGGLILALFEQPHFWIANAIYLGFVLSALVSSVVRIAAYRGAIASW